MASGSEGIPLLTDIRAPNERVRADVLVGVVADVGASRLDHFDTVRRELDVARLELAATQRASRHQQERLEQLRIDAEAEVQRLREAETETEADQTDAATESGRRIDPTASVVGGRTGAGGGGSNPASPFAEAIVCPVVSGSTENRTNRLGGLTVSLVGDNGIRYYYAHLSAYEGPVGRVDQGQVIGYVGETGNATGVPHLHFEIRPGSGVPVNPTPSVRSAGC